MRVIYACFGGAHSSPVAAAIHLGTLPHDRVPSPKHLLDLPRFDRTEANEHGRPQCLGRDDMGNDIYVLGRGAGAQPVERAFKSGFELAGGDIHELLIVNTLTCVNTPMRIGGFLSRRLKWIRLGRPLVVWGTRRAYMNLARLVETTKSRLDKGGDGRSGDIGSNRGGDPAKEPGPLDRGPSHSLT